MADDAPHIDEQGYCQCEREADEDIAAGHMTYYDSDEAFFAALDQPDPAPTLATAVQKPRRFTRRDDPTS